MAAGEVIHFRFRAQLYCCPLARLFFPPEQVAEPPPSLKAGHMFAESGPLYDRFAIRLPNRCFENSATHAKKEGLRNYEGRLVRRDLFMESRDGPSDSRSPTHGVERNSFQARDESLRGPARRGSGRTQRRFCRQNGHL